MTNFNLASVCKASPIISAANTGTLSLLLLLGVFVDNSLASPPATGGQTPAGNTSSKIPAGTILPVVLDTSLSFEKAKPAGFWRATLLRMFR